MGESPEVRYSVCLIASTCGSAAACSMNRCTLVENESYGWWTSTSPSRSVEKTLLGVSRSPNAGCVAGTNGASLRCRAVDRVHLPQARQVQQSGYLDDVAGIDVEFAQQQFEHVLGHVVRDLESHRRTEAAAGQLAFERLQEILVAVLLDLEVGVAGDPERMVLHDLHAREQHVEVSGDQILQRQERVDGGGRLVAADADEPAHVVRNLDPREVFATGRRILHRHREVETQTADVRERVGGVDGERGEDGEDLVLEMHRQALAVVVGEIGPSDDGDALRRQAPGRTESRNTRAAFSEISWVRVAISASCSRGESPSADRTDSPVSSRRLSPATRTMKNSSRLDAKIARNLARSSSGSDVSSARARTRALKSSQLSSRFR